MIHAFKIFISLFFLILFLNSYSQEVDTVYLRKLKELEKNKIDLNCFPWKKSDDARALINKTSEKVLDTTFLIGSWGQIFSLQVGKEPVKLNDQGCKLALYESGEFFLTYSYINDTIRGYWSCYENILKLLFDKPSLLYPEEGVKNWTEEMIESRKINNLIFNIYEYRQDSFLTYNFGTCQTDNGLTVSFSDFIKSDE